MLFPMSAEQEGIWLNDQLHSGASRFVESWAHRLRGPVDLEALAYAISNVIRRHEPLRSRLTVVAGQPVQEVLPATPATPRVRDVTEAELGSALREAVRRPVALDKPPLLDATVVRVADDDVVLVVTVHHAVIDGWSLGLLNQEISEHYREAVGAGPADVPRISTSYGEYARRPVDAPRDLQHWRTALDGAPAETTVPPDRPRPATLGAAGDRVPVVLDQRLGDALRRFARRSRVTPFVVLMSGLMALVGRLSGQPDAVIGTPVSRRDDADLEPLIACLTDVLPIRGQPAPGTSFDTLVESVSHAVRAAIAHRHVSYRGLVREIRDEWTLSRSPLFQIVLAVEDEPPPGLALPGITSEQLTVHNGIAKYDMFLEVTALAGGFSGWLEYSTDLFDQSTAERFVARWQAFLTAAVASPERAIGDLDILLAHERAELPNWSTGGPAVVRPLVHDAFATRARSIPDSVALVADGLSLTYGELAERSDALAARLGTPGQCVAALLDRSAELPLAILAILKAGAHCLVIDPASPAERVAFMLRDSAVSAVVTRDSTEVPDGPWRVIHTDQPAGKPLSPRTVSQDDIAYVVYTSGSTGTPKGVAMRHGSLANLVAWQVRNSHSGLGTRTLQAATPGFDVVFQEVFATWAAGGVLVVADGSGRDAERLLDLIDRHRVNRVFLSFFALRQLAEFVVGTGRPVPSLREVISAGEQVHVTPTIREFFERTGATLENQYGPSETHVVTAERLAGPPEHWPARPPIGRPIDGASVLVLDEDLRPQPIGVTGEIHVGGVPVAAGYLRRPELTRERFVRHAGARLYRTGDLGRLLPDGRIAFLGRRDDQVKVRGFRVELGEVESALKKLPGVRDAVVTWHDGRLLAYYLGVREPRPLLAELAHHLPGYAMPVRCVPVETFPLTSSGKVDRAALRPPEPSRGTVSRSPLRRRIAAVWSEVLGVGDVGADDDFFAIGGNSLSATRIALRLRAELAAPVPVAAILSCSTVSRLAAVISGTEDAVRVPASVLADDIRPVMPTANITDPSDVFLTGASGFLGGYLLRELLTRTRATVHCLARGAGPRDNLTRLGLWEPEWDSRITVHRGDLASPRLGLATGTFEKLADVADVIYHAGANVNLTWPFEQLVAANVAGTEEVLRLAALGRSVAVHHVSTAGVHIGPGPVRAAAPLPPAEDLDNGYALSKWHAERLVAQARERGLPVSVYRPTRIAADSTSGACQTRDFLWLTVKACVQAGAAPARTDLAFDLVAVDYVSAAIVELSRREPGTYQLASERLVRLTSLVDELRAIGYRVADVAPAEWLRLVAADPANAGFPLLGLLGVELASGGSESTLWVSAEETREVLAGTGIEPPVFDRQAFRAAVSYLVRIGFLPRPQ